MNYPRPPSHRTFTFGSVIIDSDFDSGNCSHASKNSLTNVTSSSHSMIFGSEQIILKTMDNKLISVVRSMKINFDNSDHNIIYSYIYTLYLIEK